MTWFPIGQSARFLADEAELTALTDQSLACSLEDFKSALGQASSGEDERGFEEDEDETASMFGHDDVIADAAAEIERRIAAINDGYPFSFDGTVLTVSDGGADAATAYVFLLLLSTPGLRGLTNGRRLFEEVVAEALARYMAGKSLRFGFPHRAPVPSHPNQAVDYFADRIGQPRIDTRKVRPKEKDMGVDAVAWKSFSDTRPTKVVLLANCSTGANWDSKLGELSIHKWNRMIDFGCDPIPIFAVPWIPNHEDWAKIVDYGYMVLDRARAASLLAGWDATGTVRRWCKRRLNEATPPW